MRAEDGAPGFVAVRLRLIGRFVGLGGLAFGIEKRISPLSLDFARDSVGMMVLGREREAKAGPPPAAKDDKVKRYVIRSLANGANDGAPAKI
jgi:hypothetical protein